MIAWLLNLAYAAALVAAAPWLLWRRIVLGKRCGSVPQKLLGLVPARTGDRRCLWFHAVSVGEVLLLPQIIAALEPLLGPFDLVISTTTVAGQQVAAKRFPQAMHVYFPLDFSWAVGRAIDRLRPDAVMLVELELWPNFLESLARRGVPVLLVNGRISEQSYRGYLKCRWLARRMLRALSALAVQNPCYADRLARLGAPAERVAVTGSVKFDGLETRRDNPQTMVLRRLLGLAPYEVVLVSGSTHEPEESLVLESYRQLVGRHGRLRLVLVPRHPERFDKVARLVTGEFGLPLMRKSQAERLAAAPAEDSRAVAAHDTVVPPPNPVLLLDTVGELSACWGLADLAFVGGSLARRGGQNMIEPAAYGAAVIVGPHTWNFSDVMSGLREREAVMVARDGQELTALLERLLADPRQAQQIGLKAQRHVLAHQGASRRTAELIAQAAGARPAIGLRAA